MKVGTFGLRRKKILSNKVFTGEIDKFKEEFIKGKNYV